MSTPSSNPWLRWLYEHDVAPYAPSAEATIEAIGVVDRAFVKARRTFLSQTPTLETYRALQMASTHQTLVISWGEVAMRYGPRRDRQRMAGPLHQMEQRFQRRWSKLTLPKSAYQSHLAKLEGKLRRAGEREWAEVVAGERAMDGSVLNPERTKRIHALQKALERRQHKLSAHLTTEGGVALRTWPAPADATAQAEAREVAQARGQRGYVVLPHTDADRFLLFNAYDASVRQRIWAQRQQVAMRPADIEALRTLRQEDADSLHAGDFASIAFEGTLFSSPSQAERWLGGALDRLRKPIQQALDEGAAKLGTGEEALLPWNFRHTLQSRYGKPNLTMPDQAFPWRATALKIIPELMALGGWSCLAAPSLLGRGHSRMLCFRLRHPDGRRAQLFYAPFNPTPKVGDQTAALCTALRPPRAYAPDTESVMFVEHYLPPKAEQQGMSVMDISYLCHELGHALHYLALPGITEGEAALIPMDLVEAPAILLEQYCRQPETLIRWLGHKAPGSLRHPAYWARRLAFRASDTLGFHRQIYRPYVDLRLARKHTGPFQQVLAEADARGGFVRHPHQREELDYFDAADEGAMGFSHIAGSALAQRLIPVYEHGQVISADVGSRFSAFLHEVLAHGVDRRTLHRNWRKLTGEGFRDSMEKGLNALTRRECRALHIKKH